jgi:hypothetical protein
MTSTQALQLERLAERLNISDGELLWLARVCSADETLCRFDKVTRVDAREMIGTLEDYERYDEWFRRNVHSVKFTTSS